MAEQGEPIIVITNPEDTRCKFILMPTLPAYKRIWRLMLLVIKGHCYLD